VRSLLLAVRFLTCVPTLWEPAIRPGDLGRSTLWFPLVGAGLGAAVAGLLSLAIPVEAAAALAVAAGAAMTRALHLDGLGDTLDGFGSGSSDRTRVLEIMKDPRAGNFAVVGIVVVLLLKFAAFSILARRGEPWSAAAPLIVSRMMMAVAMGVLPYARPQGGLGAAYFREIRPVHTVLAVLIGSALLATLPPPAALCAVGAGVVATLLVVRIARTKIGGLTGDVVGALGELAETAGLFAVALAGSMELNVR